MTPNEARTQHLANTLAGVSGLLFFYFKYFSRGADPYSSAGSPWEPLLHSLHVIVSPLLLFAVGLIWADHVWKKIARQRQKRRQTGVLLAGLFVPMAVSAYAIQVSVDDLARKVWVVVHLATSALWLACYLLHLLFRPGRAT